MGTRGITGFVVDDEEKIGYQQYDSYPDGVGLTVLQFLRDVDHDWMLEAARNLSVVSQDIDEVTPEDIERLRPFADTLVSTGQPTEWYVLLRRTQGDPGAMLEAGVVENSAEFASDSLFCEWGYIIDLDEGVLEVYKGFQQEPHAKGRFHDRFHSPSHRRDSYQPIKLVASWPLNDLPSDEEFIATTDPREED